MKKLALLGLLVSYALCAEIRINVDTGQFYSVPVSRDINQVEYNILVMNVKEKLSPANAYTAYMSKREFTEILLAATQQRIYLIHFYLKSVGTSTALRLWDDIVLFKRGWNRAFFNNGIDFLMGC